MRFFENAINSGMCPTPDTQFREIEQAFIEDVWENTTARYTILEQVNMSEMKFSGVEVWINRLVSETSTSKTNPNDFRQLLFQDLDYKCILGKYYKFDDNYWITTTLDDYDFVAKTCGVRRCNNSLKWIDSENGYLHSVPCIVEYNMESPSLQVSQDLITPNNHAKIIVQGNSETLSLDVNMRFMLGGRPFKLTAYQNAIMDDVSTPQPTLLYLDLYLDEKHAQDNKIMGVAFNGQYDYSIVLDKGNFEAIKFEEGNIKAQVLLNGSPVEREIEWSSNNYNVTVDNLGNYKVLSEPGSTSVLTASLVGNPDVVALVTISITEVITAIPEVIFVPEINKIRQHGTQTITMKINYGGQEITTALAEFSLDADSEQYLALTQASNVSCTLKGIKISLEPVNVYCRVTNVMPLIDRTEIIPITVTSMMG